MMPESRIEEIDFQEIGLSDVHDSLKGKMNDFIVLKDTEGNPLVYNSSYARNALLRHTWIQYVGGGGIIGFFNYHMATTR